MTLTHRIPSPGDLHRDLGTTLTLTAPPEFEDLNGHVNVGHYYAVHMRAVERALSGLGWDERYVERTGYSLFSIEQHLTFHDEVLIGDEITVHLRLVDRSDKVMHGLSILTNATRGTVANTLEFIEGHVSLTTRRTVAFEPDLAATLDELRDRHSRLEWELPLNGAMGVRRPAGS